MATRASDRLGYPVVAVPEHAISSPESVIRFLLGQLVQQGRLSPAQAIRAACQVVTRERQGSTAMASGVAIPHSKTDVPHSVGIIGRLSVPALWDAPGGGAVHEVCLLLLPVNDPPAHLRTLEEAVRVLSGRQLDREGRAEPGALLEGGG